MDLLSTGSFSAVAGNLNLGLEPEFFFRIWLKVSTSHSKSQYNYIHLAVSSRDSRLPVVIQQSMFLTKKAAHHIPDCGHSLATLQLLSDGGKTRLISQGSLIHPSVNKARRKELYILGKCPVSHPICLAKYEFIYETTNFPTRR